MHFSCVFILIFQFLFSCSSSHHARTSFPSRFYLDSKKDIKETLNGNTFVAHVNGLHPVLGRALTIKVRGLYVASIDAENSAEATRAFRQWHKFKLLLKESNEVELRNLERGKGGFWIWADVYLDGDILGNFD